jgi:hypothetical protein
LDFFGGNLDEPGSYKEAVTGCDGVVICALPEKPRYLKHIVKVILKSDINYIPSKKNVKLKTDDFFINGFLN